MLKILLGLWMVLALGAWAFWATRPDSSHKRLDVKRNQPKEDAVVRLGHHEVRFELEPLHGSRDKGRVAVVIWVNGLEFSRLKSSYNYDNWMNEPAGTYWQTWVDGDPHPDLRLTLTDLGTSKEYWIRGLDGQVFEYAW
jgi:hypothetical protein